VQKQSTIYFYGGAGSVTGSNFLLDTGSERILIDCGLAQGTQEALAQNHAAFAYDPSSIDYLVVTHAHLDHIGRIPKLVRAGFKGIIYSTEATRALAEPLLRDELALMMHEGHNRPIQSAGSGPLYNEEDIAHSLRLWKTLTYHQTLQLGSMTMELLNSGHILGSSMVKLSREGKHIVFTGDLGGGNSPLLSRCEEPEGTNYLVMESVYGDRTRKDSDRRERLENVIEDAAARGGTLLIPAFSTERTQDLLFEIRNLMVEKRVPQSSVYVDSPLAEQITQSYLAYPQYFAPELRKRVEAGEKLFSFPGMHFVGSQEESRGLHKKPDPKIILAGSGMGQGGRVLAHEEVILPDPKTTLLIVGYQAAGTIGRRLVEGASELELYGKKVPVRAHIEQIYGYSAHMDGEQLVEFVSKAATKLQEVFVVMGEPLASSTLVQRIRDYLGVKAIAPDLNESVAIEL
jgi:metallo-beta-lactamase family protein